ncbi:MFS family permease [Actinopolyspora biskrensis]|uniref:MFS family permease n=1 Tax=Actinopolyspora biskrensis TaxID=1470178 RepID=A0A852YV75_9ACTN|nr:MFS family permease [Actinopolyspora biskrensis]
MTAAEPGGLTNTANGARDRAEGTSGGRWLLLLLLTTVLTQTALNLIRPLISYRVIALGGDGLSIGLVTAAFAVLPVLVAVPLGRMADRTRRGWIILAAGVLLLAGGAASLGVTASVFAVAASNAVLGLGHLVFMLAAQGAVAALSPAHSLDRNFGWFTAAASAGQLVGPALSGLLLGGTHDRHLAQATTEAFWVAAAAALLALLPALLSGIRNGGSSRAETTRKPSTTALLRMPGVPSGLFVSLALLAGLDLITAYLPLIAESRGIAPAVVGLLLSLRAGASIASRLLLDRLLRFLGRTTLVTASCSVAAAGMLVVSLPTTGALGMAAGLLVGGFFLGVGQPLTMTHVVTAVPETARSTALALRLMSNRVGQVALPFAAGIIAGPVGAAGALWVGAGILATAGLVPQTRKLRAGRSEGAAAGDNSQL